MTPKRVSYPSAHSKLLPKYVSDCHSGGMIGQNARGQLNLLQETPGHVTTDVDVVMGVRLSHRIDIVLEVFHAEVVFQNLILGLVVLALQARAVFCHVDDRSAIAV